MMYKKVKCNEISNEQLQKIIKDKQAYNLIDVRTKREFEQAHIKDFLNIDYYQMIKNPEVLRELDKDKPTVVVCESGERSEGACKILKRHGYTSIYNHTYGLLYWDGQLIAK